MNPRTKQVLIASGVAVAGYLGYRWYQRRNTASPVTAPTELVPQGAEQSPSLAGSGPGYGATAEPGGYVSAQAANGNLASALTPWGAAQNGYSGLNSGQ